MKIKTILSLAIMIGVAIAVIFQGTEPNVTNRVSAQIGGGCGSYGSSTDTCGNNETCGLGWYTSTAAYYTGPGINGQELRSVNCEGTSCGSVPDISTAYFNGYCCDQDNENGFLALAIFDTPEKGGNSDGKINNQDSVFDNLLLWRDVNHNGISEGVELQNLFNSPVRELELDYKTSRRTDDQGNRFVFRAKVKDRRGQQVGRWAWDVFLFRGTP